VSEEIKPEIKKKKLNIEIKGIDIDKNEYHEIILSNSNHPEDFRNPNASNFW